MAETPRRNQNQRQNISSEKSNSNKQNRAVLSEKWNFRERKYQNMNENVLCQISELRNLQEYNKESKNVPRLNKTPPVKTVSETPMAPIKQRKCRRKIDMKPKKLIYADDDLNLHNIDDSGVLISATVKPEKESFYFKQNSVKSSNSTNVGKKPTLKQGGKKNADTLSYKLREMKLLSDEKENRPIEELHSIQNNGTYRESYLGYNPMNDSLSVCDENLDIKEKLEWLRNRRNVGLWVQCVKENCKKWRYVEEYHDPSLVPDIWHCKMNFDKTMASCSIPEIPIPPVIESDCIENKYNAGSLVWARVRGYPWWPGMIDDDVNTFTYYRLRGKSVKPVMYHVVFFEECRVSTAWLHPSCIKPFMKHTYSELVKKTKYYGVQYKHQLQYGVQTAYYAMELPLLSRLKTFGYYAQIQNNNNDSNTSLMEVSHPPDFLNFEMDIPSPTEIPRTPNSYMSLKDYYEYIICNKRKVY